MRGGPALRREHAKDALRGSIRYLVVPAENVALEPLFAGEPDMAVKAERFAEKTHELVSFLVDVMRVEAVHARLEGLLEQDNAALDAIYFCPHHPDDGCRCRKPARGMIDRAVSELQVDLRRSYLIGDHARDVQLAKAVGAKAILVTSGRVDEQAINMLRAQQAMPDTIVQSMAEAVDWILKDAVGTQASRTASVSTIEP